MERHGARWLGPIAVVIAALAAVPASAWARGGVCEASALRVQATTILVKRRVTCRARKVVKRFKPRADGTFRVRLPAPKDGEAAVFRMTTRVKHFAWATKTYPTFTLPRYVDLG